MINQIRKILEQYMEEENMAAITEATRILELDIDSFAYISALTDVEERFKLHIPDSDIAGFQTIGDLLHYLQNPWNEVLGFKTMRDLLESRRSVCGEQAAVMDLKENGILVKMTYEELYQKSMALGSYLYHQGIRNRHILLTAANSWQWIVAFFAVICGDNVIVPIDNAASSDEIKKLLLHSDSTVIFYDESTYEAVIPLDAGITKINLSEIETLIRKGENDIQDGDREFLEGEQKPEDIALFLYTSGTTGEKRGVVHDQKTIAWNAYHLNRTYLFDDRTFSMLPFHHGYGLLAGMVAILASKGTVCVYGSSKINVSKYCELYQPKRLMTVPVIVEFICKRLLTISKEEVLGKKIREIICGGAKIPEHLFDTLKEKNIVFIMGYGMTEVGTVVSVARNKEQKKSSIGKVVEKTVVKIDQGGKEAAPGEIGEILVKDDWVMRGYYKDPEHTREVLHDGWLYTGDIGYLDGQNWLYITGRKKNLIILSNGENVSPEELETIVMQCSAVKECLVEEAQGKIQVRIYPEETFRTCDDYFQKQLPIWNKGLPSYKKIRQIKLVKEPLERTSLGKLKRC